MLINKNTGEFGVFDDRIYVLYADQYPALHTNKVVLVPYCEHHVHRYHQWMKDPDIRAATASEPLCIAEEYQMQQSWQLDNDKLTFITCLPHTTRPSQQEIDSMVGDVNLFIHINEEDDGALLLVGELELMIARRENQKHGLGRAAVLTFLHYVLTYQRKIVEDYFKSPRELPEKSTFDCLRVKIKESNARSIALFESLGFKKTEVSPNFFEEFELRNPQLTLDQVDTWMEKRGVTDYKETAYYPAPISTSIASPTSNGGSFESQVSTSSTNELDGG